MKQRKSMDGFSESAWRSLAVKALRIGWPEGIRQARKRLGKSTTRFVLLTGVFEDIFPVRDDLTAILDQINDEDYDGLCQWETHHGRGYTRDFCAMEKEAVAAARDPQEVAKMQAKARAMGLPWLPQRAYNVFYTWLMLNPQRGGAREVDTTAWYGMPPAVLDGHTPEGRQANTYVTLVSGHYHNHLALSEMVEKIGWEGVRKKFHGDKAGLERQLTLFR